MEEIPHEYIRIRDMRTGEFVWTFAPLPSVIAYYHASGNWPPPLLPYLSSPPLRS